MRLNTARFGEIEVSDEQILTFTHPIIGFPEHRRFVLLPGPQDGMTYWLQSTDDGSLAFILVDPAAVVEGYAVQVGAHELEELGATDGSDVQVYTLVVVPADPRDARTNLKAPILINPKARLGKQTILERSDYPIRFYLQRREDASHGSEETLDAGSNAQGR